MKFSAAYCTLIYGLAARETAKVSSNIWNRVILPSETLKDKSKRRLEHLSSCVDL
jgi:hypothetical protein